MSFRCFNHVFHFFPPWTSMRFPIFPHFPHFSHLSPSFFPHHHGNDGWEPPCGRLPPSGTQMWRRSPQSKRPRRPRLGKIVIFKVLHGEWLWKFKNGDLLWKKGIYYYYLGDLPWKNRGFAIICWVWPSRIIEHEDWRPNSSIYWIWYIMEICQP